MKEEIIFAGFGGQGVMLMGALLTYAGMTDEKHVSWMPSYGPEMRGGTANCTVIVSDEMIASPVVDTPDTAIVMNLPSMDKFEPKVKPGGLLIYNSTLIERRPERDDIDILAVPANDLANELGNIKVGNMITLGAYLGKKEVVGLDVVKKVLKKALPERRHDLIPLNEEALDKGYNLGRAGE
ncbi:MAG: 2-oxoacid:acceptor oxidoreductase family protein [Halanaerobium sp.]|nr:2-oxoacid:acceptor oxidoreductase family protein [Halanaerobium sp.]